MTAPQTCPRCAGTTFTEHDDCGPDTWDDDISYVSWSCSVCGLWYSGWTRKWLMGVTTWQEEEGAEEFRGR